LAPADRVVLPPGCSEVVAFERELLRQSDRLRGMTIYSGLLLGDYAFLGEPGTFNYGTWHVMGPIKQRVAAGDVAFHPMRGSQVPNVFRHGRLTADVAVVHVSPPDAGGYCSLGVSTSYPQTVARLATRTIAVVNPRMPRTHDTHLHVSEIDILVEIDEPLAEHHAPAIDAVSDTIGRQVAELIPDDAVLQIGIGAIPEAVLASVAESGRTGLTLWGMGVDSIVELVERGVLGGTGKPAVVSAELMGSRRLFDFVDDNPEVLMRPFDEVLDPFTIARQGTVVSVNSAIEIDLTGQVNSEVVNGVQLSGIGGGFDFIQGALRSPDGRSVIALPSEAGRGRFSRIVPKLPDGAPVSVPRHYVQTVITEHGTARLDGLSARQRAEALIEIAAPQFREELAAAAFGMPEVAGV
jgi:4-hydroxybutyrate CoA-transferase